MDARFGQTVTEFPVRLAQKGAVFLRPFERAAQPGPVASEAGTARSAPDVTPARRGSPAEMYGPVFSRATLRLGTHLHPHRWQARTGGLDALPGEANHPPGFPKKPQVLGGQHSNAAAAGAFCLHRGSLRGQPRDLLTPENSSGTWRGPSSSPAIFPFPFSVPKRHTPWHRPHAP